MLCKEVLEIQRWEENYKFNFSALKVEKSGRQLIQAGAQRTGLRRKYIGGGGVNIVNNIEALGIKSFSKHLSSYSITGTGLDFVGTAMNQINKVS